MEYHSEIHVLPEASGFLPRLSGVNIESHLYGESSNLWDWMADAGIQVARQFHPELNLRRTPFPASWVEGIDTEEAYDAFRGECLKCIREADEEPDYLFEEEIPWLGTPDVLVRKTLEAGVQPLLSVGAHTKMFERPLLGEGGRIDWGAACCMYEYSCTLFWHYAEGFGVREFTTINEPENQFQSWYLPPELKWMEENPENVWGRLYRDDAEPSGDGLRFIESLADQYAAVVKIQRQALEDVRAALSDREQAATLRLHGPTNVVWTQLWEKAAPWLDSLDVHQYRPDRRAMRQVFRLVSSTAAASGKAVSCSEYNRQSGGFALEDFPFNRDSALEVFLLYLEALGLGSLGPAECELVCLYIFHHPSTHRNYKHLLYADMNMLDWDCGDRAPWKRAPAWYPTPEEMQIRHPTPAYRLMRMANRMLGREGFRGQLHPTGIVNPSSAGPDDLHYDLITRAYQVGEKEWHVWVINPTEKACKGVTLRWPMKELEGLSLLVRGGKVLESDKLLLFAPEASGAEILDIAPRGVQQWILAENPLAGLSSLQLEEQSFTPGSLEEGLELYQTSRLKLRGLLEDGRSREIPDAYLNWSSSVPDVLSVESSGLVQRKRNGGGEVLLRAETVDGTHQVERLVSDGLPRQGWPAPLRHLGTVGLGEAAN